MASTRMAILSLVILVFSIQGTPTIAGEARVPLRLSVIDTVNGKPTQNYSTSVVGSGVLLGALWRINEAHPKFTFTTTVDKNFGLFLESVNGVGGNSKDNTFWEILSEKSGELKPVDKGIGCYIPEENEHIVLRFKHYNPPNQVVKKEL
ncbi:cobalamin binding intrinsic factor-like [Stigmatopora nigra]